MFVCWCGFRDHKVTLRAVAVDLGSLFISTDNQTNKQTKKSEDTCGGQKKKFPGKCFTFDISTTKKLLTCFVPDVLLFVIISRNSVQ